MSDQDRKASVLISALPLSRQHSVRSLIHSIFAEHLPCLRKHAGSWEHWDEWNPWGMYWGAFGRPLGLSGPVSFKSKGGARYFYGSFPLSLSGWLGSLIPLEMGTGWEIGVLTPGSLFHAQPGCLLCLRKPEYMSQAWEAKGQAVVSILSNLRSWSRSG